jgi:hypothetical protein
LKKWWKQKTERFKGFAELEIKTSFNPGYGRFETLKPKEINIVTLIACSGFNKILLNHRAQGKS